MRPWRRAAVLAVAFALGIGGVAAASPDDRSATESLLSEVAASKRKDVGAEPAGHARAMLDRAAKLRAAGDEPHARLAESAAHAWAQAARDTVRAAEIEEKAAAARLAASDAGTVADRERALLEEGIAQSGRLRAQLDASARERKEQPARTSTQANAPDAGAKPAPKKPAAGDGGAK